MESAQVHRNSFPTDGAKAQVARLFGNGSVREGKIAARCIAETAEEWADSVRDLFKPRKDCKHCQARKDHKACRDCKGPHLSDGAVKTLRKILLECVDWESGKIEATLERIAEVSGCSRITAIRRLWALRKAGWLDWVRRIKRECEGGKWVQTANAYFFEISRLPGKAQTLLRQKLKRAGVKLVSDPSREGSGPVPSFRERMVRAVGKVAKMLGRKPKSQSMADAQFIREEMALMGDLPVECWAAVRFPNDPAAQQDYAKRLGIDPGNLALIQG